MVFKILCGAVVLALLGGFALLLVADKKEKENALLNRLESRAELATVVVHNFVTDLATRERTQAERLLAAPVVDQATFEQVANSFEFPAAVLLDGEGRLLQVLPAKPEILGTKLTETYAHLKTAVEGTVGVSIVVPSAARGVPVVAVATPFSTPSGLRVLSGAFSPESTPLLAYLEGIVPVRGSHALLLDDTGQLVAGASTREEDRTTFPSSLLRTLTQRTGEFDAFGRTFTYTQSSIPGVPWRLLLAVPSNALYAPVGGIAWASWVLWGAFAVAAMLAFVLFVRLGRLRALALKSARTDVLTAIPNRRAVMESLDREYAHVARHGGDVGILMIDIDHFKAVNDVHGHGVGDAVLAGVAQALRSTIRTEDLVGRWGGEEFLVILRAAEVIGALGLAERLRSAVENLRTHADHQQIQVTVSIGAAVGNSPPRDLIARADQALYIAKEGGRNDVFIDSRGDAAEALVGSK